MVCVGGGAARNPCKETGSAAVSLSGLCLNQTQDPGTGSCVWWESLTGLSDTTQGLCLKVCPRKGISGLGAPTRDPFSPM